MYARIVERFGNWSFGNGEAQFYERFGPSTYP